MFLLCTMQPIMNFSTFDKNKLLSGQVFSKPQSKEKNLSFLAQQTKNQSKEKRHDQELKY